MGRRRHQIQSVRKKEGAREVSTVQRCSLVDTIQENGAILAHRRQIHLEEPDSQKLQTAIDYSIVTAVHKADRLQLQLPRFQVQQIFFSV
jgi:hypothetical protein